MDDFQTMVDTLDGRRAECFSKAVELIKEQIDEEGMEFVFLLVNHHPEVLRWFDERTNSLVHTSVKLTDIRNSLAQVKWQVPEDEKETGINPFDHPEEECLFVATPQDEGQDHPLCIQLDARFG
jgi:hypothetical protein